MFVVGDRVVCDTADLVRAAHCEFAALRTLDAELGTVDLPDGSESARAETYFGDSPEFREVLAQMRGRYGTELIEIAPPAFPAQRPDPRTERSSRADAADLRRSADATEQGWSVGAAEQSSTAGGTEQGRSADVAEAGWSVSGVEQGWSVGADEKGWFAAAGGTLEELRSGAVAMVGAVFADRTFVASAELLTRGAAGFRLSGAAADLAGVVVTAVRLAACADLLAGAGFPVDPVLTVYSGGAVHTVELADALVVQRARRARLERILAEQLSELLPVQWGDPRYRACGRCAVCRAALTEARDLLLVADMDTATRTRLREAGVTTIDRLATRAAAPPEVPARVLTRLRAQAVIQLRQEKSGRPEYVRTDPAALDALPPPSPGDLALELRPFGGNRYRLELAGRDLDPVTVEFTLAPTDSGDPTERRQTREQQRRAVDLLAAATEQLLSYPDLHVYHYDSHTRAILSALADRVGAGSATIDHLLRTALLVDLRPIARSALLIGADSTSLEQVAGTLDAKDPTGSPARTLLRLAAALRTLAPGPPPPVPTDQESLTRLLGRTPSVRPSSLEFALTEFAATAPGSSVATEKHESAQYEPAKYESPPPGPIAAERTRLGERAVSGDSSDAGPTRAQRLSPFDSVADGDAGMDGDTGVGRDTGVRGDTGMYRAGTRVAGFGTAPDRGVDGDSVAREVAAYTAAALGFPRRERSAQWWTYIDRLTHPLTDWPDTPGAMVAESGVVDTKWHIGPGDSPRRFLTLTGRISRAGLAPGTIVRTVYDFPAYPGRRAPLAVRAAGTAVVLGSSVGDDFADRVRLEETLAPGESPHGDLPVAIAPAPPDAVDAAETAIDLIGQRLLMALPDIPRSAIFDILANRPPRLRDDAPLPDASDDVAAAIHTALRALDESYLVVQGPTGTGKTEILARVLAAGVVADNWRIGIVAPTAAPVENLLDAVVRAGVLPEVVAKNTAVAVAHEWMVIEAPRWPRFLANAIRGGVVGGTPAEFADPLHIPHDSLDLLVLADAGDFPLAEAMAVSLGARNLLLLGDPTDRRPPSGLHPEPVDTSVLRRITGGADTLPADRGYFLGHTRRMHPRICEPVSRRYFDDRLRCETPELPVPADEQLAEPGISTVPVDHHGNSTASDAEAREVVRQIRTLLGRTWYTEGETRRLHPHDLFVVSPHRAQVNRIRTLLSRAKIDDVLVGTPDLFRGREAAVVLLSPATSTPGDSPVPIDELLSPALIHDTLCRAMWKAIIVRSPLLTEYLPDSPAALTRLARFTSL